ncbi:rCG21183 [Rattus norvegicus]|uniref:RCG21183 n=1 Tax=Rattus norvegicus TaxID=10116 RepID=A6J0H2_RAT|nr:rCG21183 [Rattus norvegicus]
MGPARGPLPPGCAGWRRLSKRISKTPGCGTAAVRPAISGRTAPACSLRLVLSPKRNCCLPG